MTFVQQTINKTKCELYMFFAIQLCKSKQIKSNMTTEEIINCILEKFRCNKRGKLCIDDECQTCLDKSFACHEKSKYIIDVNPRFITKGSHQQCNFICPNCNHKINMKISNITYNNQWCVYCTNQQLCQEKDCNTCFNKSFASHEKSKFLVDVIPRSIFKHTKDKYNFQCPNCQHIFESSIAHVSSVKQPRWCPYCCTPQQLLCENICEWCWNSSFASHKKSKYLLDKTINPRMIFKFANDKYEFQCKTCDHSFSGLICSISNGTWCPYCCIPQQKLCKNDKCIWCWNTSFANYEKSRFLADKTINPRMIINGSETYHKFICENNHEFNTVIKNVTKGHWCGICKNKTETKLYQFLVENISANCQTQIKFDWCKIKRRLPFDFYIQKLKILIELDGDQHFIQVAQWKTPEEVLERDIIKMKLAIKNGLSMIRITQDDVWYDKNNWQERILDAIKTVNEYDQVIIYLENKKDYKLHQKAMREIDILQLTI